MKCVILTTDTKHHRYFANRISRKAETTVILERRRLPHWKLYWRKVRHERTIWSMFDNPYLRPGYRGFRRLQDEFEAQFFADDITPDFNGYSTIYESYSVNDGECVELVRTLRPDLIVSFGTGLIKSGVLTLDGLKINIHRGILPKYRGLDSDLWAFYFCDFDNVGTTVHELHADVDTGHILRQAKLDVRSGMKVYQIRYYTTVMATDMVEDIIRDLMEGKFVAGVPQDLSQGRYYSYIPPLRRMLAIWRFNRHVAALSSLDSRGACEKIGS